MRFSFPVWPKVFSHLLRFITIDTHLGHRLVLEPIAPWVWDLGKIRKRTDRLYLLHLAPRCPLCEGDVVENAQKPVPEAGAVSRFRQPPSRRIADHVHGFASLGGPLTGTL